MHMVQWADLTGAGFARHEVGGEPVEPKFWRAARILKDERQVSQPPPTLRRTQAHPVWGLRRVSVEGEPWWCFTVQGRGGNFGFAGTCRFAFLPEDMPPAEVWRTGVERVVAEDPRPSARTDRVERGGMAAVLAGLAMGLPAVLIPGSPSDAAMIIERILEVLPLEEVRDRVWSTCLLQSHDPHRMKLVAAHWPPDFQKADPELSALINESLPKTPLTRSEVVRRLGRGSEAAVSWVATAAVATDGKGWRPPPGITTMSELLDAAYRRFSEITLDNIEHLSGIPAEHGRLLEHFDVVTKWARGHLAAALDVVKRMPDGPLRDRLFKLLCNDLRRSKRNTIGLPIFAGPVTPEWRRDLAALILTYCYHDSVSVKVLIRDFRGGVLRSGADFYAARDLWLELGYEPQDSDFIIRVIVDDEITQTGAVSARAYRELQRMGNPIQLLVEVVKDRSDASPNDSSDGGPHIPSMAPATAADLLGVFLQVDSHSGDRYVREIGRIVAVTSLPADPQEAEHWLTVFLRSLKTSPEPQGSARQLVQGAWEAFRRHASNQLSGSELEQLLKDFGIRKPVPVTSKPPATLGTGTPQPQSTLYDPAKAEGDGKPVVTTGVRQDAYNDASGNGGDPPGGHRRGGLIKKGRRVFAGIGAHLGTAARTAFLVAVSIIVLAAVAVSVSAVSGTPPRQSRSDKAAASAPPTASQPSSQSSASPSPATSASPAVQPSTKEFFLLKGRLHNKSEQDIVVIFVTEANNAAEGHIIRKINLKWMGRDESEVAILKSAVEGAIDRHEFDRIPILRELEKESVVIDNGDPHGTAGVKVVLTFA